MGGGVSQNPPVIEKIGNPPLRRSRTPPPPPHHRAKRGDKILGFFREFSGKFREFSVIFP